MVDYTVSSLISSLQFVKDLMSLCTLTGSVMKTQKKKEKVKLLEIITKREAVPEDERGLWRTLGSGDDNARECMVAAIAGKKRDSTC